MYLVLIATLVLASLSPSEADKEVNVYSHRHYDADRLLFKKFTVKTGIVVNVVKASADQLIKRLEIEGDYSPADLLITVDAGRLYRAQQKEYAFFCFHNFNNILLTLFYDISIIY